MRPWALAGGVLLCLAAGAPARAAAPVSTPVLVTQTTRGNASGEWQRGVDTFVETGRYATGGQLGSGTFALREANLTSTARFVRDDGLVLTGTFVSGSHCTGESAGTYCWIVDVTGSSSSDIAAAHLEMVGADARILHGFEGNAWYALNGVLTLNHRAGYLLVDTNGHVFAFGGAQFRGGAPTTGVVHIEPTPSGAGYWIVNASGQVFSFGDATWQGNAAPASFATGEHVTSLSSTPTGHGYWLFTTRGRAIPRGDARFFGDMHAIALNGPVIASVATPTGNGYYMIGGDGGVFAFGDAVFRGSMGGVWLNQPVMGIAPSADNSGYWLVARDGGVFALHAPFHGSMGGVKLVSPIVDVRRYGAGYLMAAGDGGVFNLSKKPFFGSLAYTPLQFPIVSATAIG